MLLAQRCVLCNATWQSAVCTDCATALHIHTQYCRGCGVSLTSTHLHYCGTCLTTPFNFDRVYALYTYNGLIQELMHRFKYHKNLSIGKFFAQQIQRYYDIHKLYYDAILPMPLHPKRMKKRGFNQSMELSRCLSNVNTHALRRIKYTQEMNNLNPKERIQQIRGAFKVKYLKVQRILIVDDVLTTASSVNELSKAIRKHYKRHNYPVPSIDVLVLARAIIHN